MNYGMKLKNRESFSKKTSRFLFYTFLIIMIVLTIYPFLIMVSGSFKADLEMNRYPVRLFPRTGTTENYQVLFNSIPFFRQYLNSIFVSLVSASAAMLLNSIVAYGFTRFDFKGKQSLFTLVIATMLIPPQVYMVPQFQMYKSMGLFGSYIPLIIPALTNAFGIYLITQIMAQVPKDLYESATIDGCMELGILFRIAVPLSAAGIGIQGVLTFMNTWNDFMTPLLYLNSEIKYTLPIGLMRLQNFYKISYGAPLAGAFLSCIPVILILILVGQKYFVQGLMAGAVKG